MAFEAETLVVRKRGSSGAKNCPPRPAPAETKAPPPVGDPRAGGPNSPVRLGVPNPVVAPRPVAKVLVPRGVPNVEPDVRLVLPSPVVVLNGFLRDAVPAVSKVLVTPAGFF